MSIPIPNFALDGERLLVVAAVHRRHHVGRQGQTLALQPLLQPCLRILERRRVGQALELVGKHEIDDSFRRRRTAVKQNGAKQRFDGICQDCRALRAAGAQLAGPERQLLVDAQCLADGSQRRFLD